MTLVMLLMEPWVPATQPQNVRQREVKREVHALHPSESVVSVSKLSFD